MRLTIPLWSTNTRHWAVPPLVTHTSITSWCANAMVMQYSLLRQSKQTYISNENYISGDQIFKHFNTIRGTKPATRGVSKSPHMSNNEQILVFYCVDHAICQCHNLEVTENRRRLWLWQLHYEDHEQPPLGGASFSVLQFKSVIWQYSLHRL